MNVCMIVLSHLQVSDHTDDMELNTFILSHVFWPSFKGENFKPPAEIQESVISINPR